MHKAREKTKSVFLCCILVIFMIGLTAISASAYEAFYGVVRLQHDPNLNIRKGPGVANDADHAVIASIPNNDEMLVIDRVPCDTKPNAADWYRVIYHNYTGYISSNPVQYSRAVEYPFIGVVVTEKDPLNMRKTPNTTGTKITSIPKGSEITVTKVVAGENTSFNWFYVKWNGYEGYVSSEFVRYVRPAGDRPRPDPKPVVPPGTPAPKPNLNPNLLPHTTEIPEIYKPYLEGIMSRHKNWKFEFHYFEWTWENSIKEESTIGKNLIQITEKGFPLSYRNPNYTNVIEGKTWYAASPQVISYFMDPRNAMTEDRLFQFQTLYFDPNIQNLEGCKKIISKSYMANKTLVNREGKTITYAEAFMDAANASGISPYHLIYRVFWETGRNQPSNAVTGKYPGHEGYYNFYNIGANTKGDRIANTLDWAAKTVSNDVVANHGRPWTTPYQSIVEGAKFIAMDYVGAKQDTLYYQKFDLIPPHPYRHQYMTNVASPYSESVSNYNIVKETGKLDQPMTFKIPVFVHMGAVPHLPDFDTKDHYNRKRGDVTGDANLTLADYNEVLSHVRSGKPTDTGIQFISADMNDDMAIDAFDLALLDRKIIN